jgi:hypothetical protein
VLHVDMLLVHIHVVKCMQVAACRPVELLACVFRMSSFLEEGNNSWVLLVPGMRNRLHACFSVALATCIVVNCWARRLHTGCAVFAIVCLPDGHSRAHAADAVITCTVNDRIDLFTTRHAACLQTLRQHGTMGSKPQRVHAGRGWSVSTRIQLAMQLSVGILLCSLVVMAT